MVFPPRLFQKSSRGKLTDKEPVGDKLSVETSANHDTTGNVKKLLKAKSFTVKDFPARKFETALFSRRKDFDVLQLPNCP